MKKVFDTLTKSQTIQRIILVMLIVSILAIIFTLVVILRPNLFPRWVHIRESVLTLATCSMVLSTLILAFGTFSVITHDREREQRLRKERYVNEIIEWSQDIQQILHDTNPATYILKGKDLVSILLNTCKNLQRRTKSMEYIADFLDKDLKNAIQHTSSKLNSCTDACSEFLLTQEGPQLKDASIKFVKLAVDTVKSTDEVIKQASNIKISLLL